MQRRVTVLKDILDREKLHLNPVVSARQSSRYQCITACQGALTNPQDAVLVWRLKLSNQEAPHRSPSKNIVTDNFFLIKKEKAHSFPWNGAISSLRDRRCVLAYHTVCKQTTCSAILGTVSRK